MEKSFANPLQEQGATLLEAAHEELRRPDEDVVALLPCQHIRKAIQLFLSDFLETNGEPAAGETLEDLFHRCAALDARFHDLDLSVFECRSDKLDVEKCYCDDALKIRECLAVARQIEGLVGNEAPTF